LLAARLTAVYGAGIKPRIAISKITAAENPLTGRVAEVRLLQKL
jgi:hypothetical protein